jgi:hypothetical protein
MFRTIITAAVLATASFAFIPASQAENLGSPGDQPLVAPNSDAQPEAYRGYGYRYNYGYARPSYNYGYARPSYGYVRPSYDYVRPYNYNYGYGYGYGGYRGW